LKGAVVEIRDRAEQRERSDHPVATRTFQADQLCVAAASQHFFDFSNVHLFASNFRAMPAKSDRAGDARPHHRPASPYPLVAAILGDLAVIGTVRARRSQWISNAAVSPKLRYFRFGRAREAQAFVFIPSERELVLGSMSLLARLVGAPMQPSAEAANFAFAILIDRS
jgi:hypothetical protein